MDSIIGLLLFIALLATAISAGRAAAAAQECRSHLLALHKYAAAAGMRYGISSDDAEPPCHRCAKKGKGVRLKRNAKGALQCPECGRVRIGV